MDCIKKLVSVLIALTMFLAGPIPQTAKSNINTQTLAPFANAITTIAQSNNTLKYSQTTVISPKADKPIKKKLLQAVIPIASTGIVLAVSYKTGLLTLLINAIILHPYTSTLIGIFGVFAIGLILVISAYISQNRGKNGQSQIISGGILVGVMLIATLVLQLSGIMGNLEHKQIENRYYDSVTAEYIETLSEETSIEYQQEAMSVILDVMQEGNPSQLSPFVHSYENINIPGAAPIGEKAVPMTVTYDGDTYEVIIEETPSLKKDSQYRIYIVIPEELRITDDEQVLIFSTHEDEQWKTRTTLQIKKYSYNTNSIIQQITVQDMLTQESYRTGNELTVLERTSGFDWSENAIMLKGDGDHYLEVVLNRPISKTNYNKETVKQLSSGTIQDNSESTITLSHDPEFLPPFAAVPNIEEPFMEAVSITISTTTESIEIWASPDSFVGNNFYINLNDYPQLKDATITNIQVHCYNVIEYDSETNNYRTFLNDEKVNIYGEIEQTAPITTEQDIETLQTILDVYNGQTDPSQLLDLALPRFWNDVIPGSSSGPIQLSNGKVLYMAKNHDKSFGGPETLQINIAYSGSKQQECIYKITVAADGSVEEAVNNFPDELINEFQDIINKGPVYTGNEIDAEKLQTVMDVLSNKKSTYFLQDYAWNSVLDDEGNIDAQPESGPINMGNGQTLVITYTKNYNGAEDQVFVSLHILNTDESIETHQMYILVTKHKGAPDTYQRSGDIASVVSAIQETVSPTQETIYVLGNPSDITTAYPAEKNVLQMPASEMSAMILAIPGILALAANEKERKKQAEKWAQRIKDRTEGIINQSYDARSGEMTLVVTSDQILSELLKDKNLPFNLLTELFYNSPLFAMHNPEIISDYETEIAQSA